MSEGNTIQLRFANDAERKRYWKLRESPKLHDCVSMGANVAKDWLLPRIQDGHGTCRPGFLDEMAADFLRAGLSDLRKQYGRAVTPAERFMFRKGYEAVALPAKEAAGAMAQAGEKLGEALALAQAAIQASSSALGILNATLPAIPAAPVHALAMGNHRSLKREDLGALPPMRPAV